LQLGRGLGFGLQLMKKGAARQTLLQAAARLFFKAGRDHNKK